MGAGEAPTEVSTPKTRIFLSYRRDDSGDVTGRIYDRLVRHFGADQVVRDVDDIPLGVDFVDYIEDKLSNCRWCLAIIGDRWTSIKDAESDGPRIMQSNDNVRLELEVAFEQKIMVVPICVRGAHPPKADELPESLHKLPRRNGLKVRRDPDFNRDMEKLVAALSRHTPLLKGQSAPRVSTPPNPTPPTAPPPDISNTSPSKAAEDARRRSARYRPAEALDESDQLDEAMDAYRALLESDPSDHTARARLAALLSDTSQLEAALTLCRDGRAHGESAEVIAAQSKALAELHQFDEARLFAQRATQLDPKCGDAWAALANVAAILGDKSAEDRALERGLAHHPEHLELRALDALRDERAPQDALQRMQALLSEASRDRMLRGYYGSALKRADLDQDALRQLRKLVARNPRNHVCQALCGLWEITPQSFEVATQYIDQSLSLYPDSLFAVLARSAISMVQGDLDAAKRDLTFIEERAPGSALYGGEVARLLMHVGEPEAAREKLYRLLRLRPASTYLRLTLADIEIETDHLEDALREIDRALRDTPTHHGAIEKKGEVLIRLGRLDDAEVVLAEVPDCVTAHRLPLCVDERRLEQSEAPDYPPFIARCRRHLARFPEDEYVWGLVMAFYMSRGRVAEMAAMFPPALPKAVRAALLGCAHGHAGQFEQMVDALEQVLDAPPIIRMYSALWSEILEWATLPELAHYRRALILRALDDAPEVGTHHYHWGCHLEEAGDDTNALEAFREALQRDETLYDAHFRMGNLYFGRHAFSDALRCYEACRDQPEAVAGVVHQKLAVVYEALGRGEEHRDALGVAQERSGWVTGTNSVICGLLQAAQYDAARSLLNTALEAHPQSPGLLETKAYLLRESDDQPGELRALKRASQLAPDSPSIATSMAFNLERQGHHAKADAQFRRACRISDTPEVATINYGEFLVRQRRVDDAASIFRTELQGHVGPAGLKTSGAPLLQAWLRVLINERELRSRCQRECDRWMPRSSGETDHVIAIISAVQQLIFWYDSRLYEMSLNEVASAMEVYPSDSRFAIANADLLWHRGKRQEALDAIEEATARWPDSLDALHSLLKFLVASGQESRAEGILAARQAEGHFDADELALLRAVLSS